MFVRLPQGKIFLKAIDMVAPVSSTPRNSRPPSRIRTGNTRSRAPPERPRQNSAGQVTSNPLFRNLQAILMKRVLFLALPSSLPSCSRLAPCSCWASVRERVVGPDCPPEGSEFPNNPKAARITELLADLDHWVGWLTPGSYGSDELLLWLVAKIPTSLWDDCRATAERKTRTLTYEDLSVLLLQLALEKESDQHLDVYRPRGRGSGSLGKGYRGPRPGHGTTPKHTRIMGQVQEFLSCDGRDQHGHLQHAPDCDQRDCFVVQGKKQETNTGAKCKLPDHYRCTITCAFCGKRKHYEDECYHKQRLSAKLKGEDPGKGFGKGGGKGYGNNSGNGGGKGYGNESGKGKSKGHGERPRQEPRWTRRRR